MKTAALLAIAGTASGYTVTTADRFMLKNVDPIVSPGGFSHLHSFFGSDAVTTNTTTSKELQAGCSTNQNPNDYSSYWVPTLFALNDSGATVVPMSRFSAYYVAIESAEVAIPQDYQSVVGNAKATSQDDVEPLAGIEWFCEDGPAGEPKDLAAFPTETCSTHLQTLLLFHDCVNEDTLESTYSGTHHWTEEYKADNRCPINMKRMPQLRFSIRYDLRKVLPDGWSGTAPLELACGSSYCTHGDFINGWLPEAAENMLLANSKRDFAGVDGPDGAYDAGSICGSENAVDADPGFGTSDYEESKRILEEQATEEDTEAEEDEPAPSETAAPETSSATSVSAQDAPTPSATTSLVSSAQVSSLSSAEISSAPTTQSSSAEAVPTTECKLQGKHRHKGHGRHRKI